MSVNKDNLIYRDVKESDVDEIYHLYQLEGWASFDRGLVDKLVLSSDSMWVVAENQGEVLGFARYLTDGVLTVFLAEIIVKEEYRRMGIGEKMVERIFLENPKQRLELATDSPEFYEALKFRHIGRAYRRYKGE